MRFRKLRIAISAVSLVACVVLITMWVRSYYSVYRWRATGQGIEIVSWKGVVTFNPRVIMTGQTFKRTTLAQIPYLPPVLMLITLGGLPWVQWYWGFSLRAMLIAMTLVAILLGVIAASR
ncbi:MAG TPA: hypothetical protein VHK01_02895 [Lacipirellulaceae bacterium]|nr:hypothetical protein [Lacipirellulaceae bacterium]